MWGKILKLCVYLTEERRNALVSLHLQPQTCDFSGANLS